jgi:hypothetical protein
MDALSRLPKRTRDQIVAGVRQDLTHFTTENREIISQNLQDVYEGAYDANTSPTPAATEE